MYRRLRERLHRRMQRHLYRELHRKLRQRLHRKQIAHAERFSGHLAIRGMDTGGLCLAAHSGVPSPENEKRVLRIALSCHIPPLPDRCIIFALGISYVESRDAANRLEFAMKERCGMTQNRNDGEVVNKAESADRRQFLRNAMRIGGAAALLLTSASREMLAHSLTLSSHDLDAARRAREIKGSRPEAGRMEASAAPSGNYNGCDCSGCSGCTSSCTGCNGCSSCSGCNGCTGTCTGCKGNN